MEIRRGEQRVGPVAEGAATNAHPASCGAMVEDRVRIDADACGLATLHHGDELCLVARAAGQVIADWLVPCVPSISNDVLGRRGDEHSHEAFGSEPCLALLGHVVPRPLEKLHEGLACNVRLLGRGLPRNAPSWGAANFLCQGSNCGRATTASLCRVDAEPLELQALLQQEDTVCFLIHLVLPDRQPPLLVRLIADGWKAGSAGSGAARGDLFGPNDPGSDRDQYERQPHYGSGGARGGGNRGSHRRKSTAVHGGPKAGEEEGFNE
mmetsp:Transcript_48616/g.123832  ORF Transcript_48616/g.123832 Transcript_48616/m.123832 type:complete len:266 (-) Transcript_48616:56-853(-)